MLTVVFMTIVWLPIPVGIGSFFGMVVSKKNLYLYYFLFCTGVSLVTLWYIPDYTSDLSRYFETMKSMQSLSGWSEFLDFSQNDRILQYQGTNKIFNMIEYLVAKTGRFSILPFISTFTCYLLVLFPIVDLKKQKKLSPLLAGILSLYLLMLFNLNLTANTMRWAMACAIFGFVAYIYFVKIKDIKFIWILVIPVLFHLGIILAVGLAIFVAIFRKATYFSYALLSIGFVMFWLYVAKNSDTTSSGVLYQMTSMANTYSTDFMIRNSNGRIVLYLTRMAGGLVFIATLIIGFGRKKIERDNFDRLCLAQFVFWILLFNNSMIFNRYVLVSSMLGVFYLGKNSALVNSAWVRSSLFFVLTGLLMISVIAYAGFKKMTFSISLPELVTTNLISLLTNIPIF